MSMRTAGLMVCMVAALGGCSSKPDLSRVNPPGLDFSGTWIIDFSASGSVADLGNPNRPGTPLDRRMSRRDAVRIAKGSDLEFISVDFQVLRADKMIIELSRESMGIRYQPGVYRDISWGERQRGLWEVTAGWQEDNLVVISEAGRLRVVETLSRTGPNELTVRVNIDIDSGEQEIVRVFNRR